MSREKDISSCDVIVYICLSIVLIASYFAFFWRLDAQPIQLWDESRVAMNAVNMTQTGDPMITYYDGEADLWNTKPPLLVWIQAIFIKLFGVNELSVRIPSALASLGTVLTLLFFCRKYLGSTIAGLASSLLLITTPNFVIFHVSRHGDYDALLIFFLVLSSLNYFLYLENTKKVRRLYLSIIFLTAAVLTKGVAGLLFLPAFLIYTLYKRRLKEVIFNRHLYFGIGIFSVAVGGFYIGRELLEPGYLQAVMENEVTGRYGKAIEGHRGPFWYYLDWMVKKEFIPWVFLLPLIIVLFFYKERRYKYLGSFTVIFIVSYFLIISFAETKLGWYQAPLMPFACLGLGAAFSIFLEYIFKRISKIRLRYFLKIATVLILVAVPYYFIIKQIGNATDITPEHATFRAYFRHLQEEMPDLKSFTVYDYQYNAPAKFYIKKLEIEEGYEIYSKEELRYQEERLRLYPGELILACERPVIEEIENNYNFRVYHEKGNCKTYIISTPINETPHDEN